MARLADQQIRDYAIRYGTEYRLDPSLVYAVIMTESSGDPLAVNPSDPSAGLMQVMIANGRAFGHLRGSDEDILEMLKDPDRNLRSGCGFISHIYGLFGHMHKTTEWIQAYNVGIHGFSIGRRNTAYGERVAEYMADYAKGPGQPTGS